MAYTQIKLSNGVTISGADAQVTAMLRKLGEFVPDGVHYNSSTHGIVRIDSMDERHLINALKKIERTHSYNMQSASTTNDLVEAVLQRDNDRTRQGILVELASRMG